MEVSGYQGSMGQISQNNTQKALGKNDFFKILSAQLQFQDPLSGGDNSEYVAQMAQFSALEQMENLNMAFEVMLYYQNTQYASELIGKEVTLTSENGLIKGTVDKVKLSDGYVRILIDGNEYGLHQIREIEDVESKEI